jgi:acetyl-CoA carboxylase biotin carboxylase subunit
MCEVAVRAAEAIGYECAGTVEFLVDEDHRFYFLEMNTRLQVEHPITEMVVGVDLVQAMVRVAMGEPLHWPREALAQRGHSVECRVYAEDPYNDFLPSPGRLFIYRRPSGPFVRVDDGVEEGCEVSPFYDPLIAKLVVWGEDRDQAIRRAVQALREYRIGGVRHNIPFLIHALESKEFASGRYDTGFVGRLGPMPAMEPDPMDAMLAVAARHFTRPAPGMSGFANPRPSAWRHAAMPANRGWR